MADPNPTYIDPTYSGGGSDGSSSKPFTALSQLAAANSFASNTTYLFAAGTTLNLTTIPNVSGKTGVAISRYGEGANPVLTAYRATTAGEWTEIDPSVWPGTVTPLAGTNFWRIADRFFGLFPGDIIGIQKDPTNVAGGGVTKPAAPYEWAYLAGATPSVNGQSTVYSVGNPVTTYGGMWVSSFGLQDFDNQVGILRCNQSNNVEIYGIDFNRGLRAISLDAGNPNTVIYSNINVHDCNIRNVYRGIQAFGAGGSGFYRCLIHDNYFSNIGAAAICSMTGVAFNQSRVYRNVVNGGNKAYSDGCFYFSNTYAKDGSRLQVYWNSASGVEAGHYWPNDGYALYAELGSANILFRENFVWNCTKPAIVNVTKWDVQFWNNVFIAKAGTDNAFSFTAGSGAANNRGSSWLYGNVAKGFANFLNGYLQSGTATRMKIQDNICLGSGSNGSVSGNHNACSLDSSSSTVFTINNNQFYNFLYQWWNTSSGGSDNSSAVTNQISTDPTSILTNLPTPSDATVNYALQVPFSMWASCPGGDLQIGIPA